MKKTLKKFFQWLLHGEDREKETEFLPAILEVTETPPSPTGRLVMWTILILVCVALAWAFLGKINEVVAWGIVCNGRIFENGEVAFLPTELRRILEDELKFPSANKLINEWKEQGNVLITDKDRLTHKAPIGDDRPRTIHFKARILVTCPDDEELLYYEEKGVV